MPITGVDTQSAFDPYLETGASSRVPEKTLEQDDFLEGVEIMLAEDFMKQATGSNLHLVF